MQRPTRPPGATSKAKPQPSSQCGVVRTLYPDLILAGRQLGHMEPLSGARRTGASAAEPSTGFYCIFRIDRLLCIFPRVFSLTSTTFSPLCHSLQVQ